MTCRMHFAIKPTVQRRDLKPNRHEPTTVINCHSRPPWNLLQMQELPRENLHIPLSSSSSSTRRVWCLISLKKERKTTDYLFM
jgi:hypothetical protein